MKEKLLIKNYLILILISTINLQPVIKFSTTSSALGLDRTNTTFTLNTSITGVDGTIKLRTTTGTTDGNVKSATGAETISFSGGSILQDASQVDLIGGTYDPKTGSTRDAISLGNGQIMSVGKGTTVYADVAVANGATATILGCPTFVSSVSLGNSSSVLNIGIQNKLNKDIVLNSGKLVLQDNLELADGVRIWGTGTVDINYQSLRFGSQVNSSVFSQDLTFWRAKDITLNGPVTLAGNWSFLTNSTDNESVINGNGNILTLSNGKLIVGDATAGHTLYISDCHIKGFSSPAYTVFGLTKATYTGISGLSGTVASQGSLSYDAGFTVLATNPTLATSTSNCTYSAISVYDDATPANSLIYGMRIIFVRIGAITTNPSPGGLSGGEHDVDVGTDQTAIQAQTSTISTIGSNAFPITSIRTSANYVGTFKSITCGSANYIYVVKSTDTTRISKYLGSVNNWNDNWGTGYTSIIDITASNDGWVWVLDNTGAGTYTLTKTNGGTKGSGTNITLPENPTTYNSSLNAISLKGSLSSHYGTYCGTSGIVYRTTDGFTTFSSLGNFGAVSAAAGALGTIAFMGPYDPNISDNGSTDLRATFVKPPGASNGFSLYDGGATDANRGKVVLSNVTLEMAGNYTHSTGRITFKGDNCKIITGGNKTFTISGSNAPVEVDSVALIYETLGGTNTSPFSGTAVTLTNGGVVRSAVQAVAPSDYTIDANAYNGSSAPTLTQNYTLYAASKISVTNTSGAASQTVTVNGGNYFWDFPGGTVTGLAIADKVTVTLTNVILKNFSLANVSFGGANAALVFGDGCIIELGADQSLTTGQGAWLFSGNATIRGMGQTITLNNADSIKQSVANKTLTISNTILKSLNTGSLSAISLATVALTNSILQINTGGFSWATGNLDVNGYSKLSSMNITTSGGSSTFTLSTSGNLTINTGSTLELGRAINFAYSPTTTGDSGGITGTVAKRHVRIGLSGDASATLYANHCTIDSTAVGMALDRGNLVIDNLVNWTASTTASYESEIGSAVNVDILAGGVLGLDGGVKYTVTTV